MSRPVPGRSPMTWMTTSASTIGADVIAGAHPPVLDHHVDVAGMKTGGGQLAAQRRQHRAQVGVQRVGGSGRPRSPPAAAAGAIRPTPQPRRCARRPRRGSTLRIVDARGSRRDRERAFEPRRDAATRPARHRRRVWRTARGGPARRSCRCATRAPARRGRIRASRRRSILAAPSSCSASVVRRSPPPWRSRVQRRGGLPRRSPRAARSSRS